MAAKTGKNRGAFEVMKLVPAIASEDSDRYIGCHELCPSSHAALDLDTTFKGRCEYRPQSGAGGPHLMER